VPLFSANPQFCLRWIWQKQARLAWEPSVIPGEWKSACEAISLEKSGLHLVFFTSYSSQETPKSILRLNRSVSALYKESVQRRNGTPPREIFRVRPFLSRKCLVAAANREKPAPLAVFIVVGPKRQSEPSLNTLKGLHLYRWGCAPASRSCRAGSASQPQGVTDRLPY
jgi:hypothetical protein